jgi:hypothetical protein
VSSEIVISTGVSSIRARMCATIQPTTTPMAAPPSMAPANMITAVLGANAPPAATTSAIP